ncbi:hypothetical protein [Cryobacterium arcticum]|uniref:Uncharacterized protein n=1 Tax=Cryobacterium arcticum TaxID=670052 RepID=A0A1B1BQJ4_9MICO|nr:hypothetical protein [Cryobacterium arcticum]ANP74805.1 hypothetical protein PA27867_3892 [Cryobacterium arcticum]
MESQRRAHSPWASSWGEFAYRAAAFLRVVALLAGVVITGLVLVHLVRDGWAPYLLQACGEAFVFLTVGILLQLVVLVHNRAARP